MHMRLANAGDMAAIAALYRPFVLTSTVTFELEAPDAAEMQRRWKALVDAGYPYYAALNDQEELLGFAYCGPFRSRPAYRYCCENSVYIAPQARRRGLAGALMEQIIADAQASGMTQMLAVITDTNETAASLAFHESLGFKRVGTLEKAGFKFERWLDVALLQRSLE
jgi:phosphinothricin acetyltransferase